MARAGLVRGEGDPGLFGPGSVTWRIHADPSMIVGGLRALLIQALNSPTMAGVAQHSDYKQDSWSRLLRTTDFIMATTYGDRKAAERAVARVRSIHERVRGIDPVTGRAYYANDPDLLLWVHSAEVDSFLEAYKRYGGRLGAEEADRYVAEMVAAAELIGIPRADVPDSVGALREYLNGQEMIASDYARDAMKFVLFPPVPWPGGKVPEVPGGRLLLIPGRAGWSLYSLATIAILPRNIRRMYRLPWVPLTPALQAAVFAMTRTMRTVFPPPPIIQEAIARRKELEGAA